MSTQRHIEDMLEKLKTLPPARVAEVEDFIDFLHSRDGGRRLVRAAQTLSEPSLTALWDNADDAAYDRL